MQMTDEQLKLITTKLSTIKDCSPFYAEKFKDIDPSDVRTQEDFEKLPFSEKDDLRRVYPLGLQAVPDEEVVRIHSSSGTTGTPVIIPYTAQDVTDWAIQFERCYRTAGITNLDRIQITPGYGLWTAGIGFQAGAEKLGAMAVPMGKIESCYGTNSIFQPEIRRQGFRRQIAFRRYQSHGRGRFLSDRRHTA